MFCADLTNKAGYWAKALAERFCERDTILFYYVTTAGDVHFGINGEEKGVFFSGVETRGPLWAMMDVYGNSTAVELLDAKNQLKLNNSRRCVGRELLEKTIRLHRRNSQGVCGWNTWQQINNNCKLIFYHFISRADVALVPTIKSALAQAVWFD